MTAILAVNNQNLLGSNNKLAWYCKNDLMWYHFFVNDEKIVIGRKTFESMFTIYPKQLSGKTVYVLTNNKTYTSYNNIIYIHSILDIPNDAIVCGGKEIYNLLIPKCDTVFVSHIDADTPPNIENPVYINLDLLLSNFKKSLILSKHNMQLFKYIKY